MSDFDDSYKQWLINKILSGQFDYTYGPGSPGATPSDMRQVTGSRNNQLTTGDIALPPSDYNLFTPAEREKYRIADTSFIRPGQPTPTGSVERYFGGGAPSGPTQTGDGMGFGNFAARSMVASGQSPAGWTANINALTQPSATDRFASSIGAALEKQGQAGMQAAEQGSQQALKSFLNRPQPGQAILAQLAANPLMYLNNPYLT